MELVVCARCARHVRVHARECPFCGSAQRETTSRLRSRLGRSAILAAVAATSCHHGGAPSSSTTTDASDDDAMHVKITVYGGPPPLHTVMPPTRDGGTD